MPRLLIDATPVGPDAKGVGRYAYHVCLQMAARLPQGWTTQILVHAPALSMFPQGLPCQLISVPQSSELMHGAFTLPRQVKNFHADILLKTLETSGQVRIPTVTICHDIDSLILAAQRSQQSVFRRGLDGFKYSRRREALRHSKFIICNSEFTRAGVQSNYGISPDRTSVAYCAVDPGFYEISSAVDREKVKQQYGVRNFILTFATGDPRENFKLLPAIAQELKKLGVQTCLLIAGIRPSSSYRRELRSRFVESGLLEGKHFILESFLGADRFAELAGLYTAADFYLELSLHEGFGMQLVEAMACGATCVTSPNGALSEVSGGYGVLIDPASAENIGTTLKVSYDANLHLRDNRGQIAYTRKFSWDTMGEAVSGVLVKLAE